ncbi:MAG: CDP-diacylglycerol--glycerol-3-phosphate 3-phosphatidyltransferase [Proteobacteria bacterium]|nr:CDP-diacylglycerol--glycerol-3-phosphate 3-phosphatidyltransferase [Pseudomonadota bacterium]
MNPAALPNLLTGARLVLGLVMFICLAGASGNIPFLSDSLTPEAQFGLQRWSFVAFVLAAVTDFFDGWAARRWNAESVWGAILDPIADKILVAGTILGLGSLGANPHIVAPGALILFREFFVSALREVGAGRGVKFPVTPLAKWKTTLQLVALGAQLIVASWPAWRLPSDPGLRGPFEVAADVSMWVAAAVTLWTGWIYWRAARSQMAGAQPA